MASTTWRDMKDLSYKDYKTYAKRVGEMESMMNRFATTDSSPTTVKANENVVVNDTSYYANYYNAPSIVLDSCDGVTVEIMPKTAEKIEDPNRAFKLEKECKEYGKEIDSYVQEYGEDIEEHINPCGEVKLRNPNFKTWQWEAQKTGWVERTIEPEPEEPVESLAESYWKLDGV